MTNHHPTRTPTTRAASNSSMRTLTLVSKLALVLACPGLLLQDAGANPGGEAVVAGSVDIQRRQDLMQIQASDGAIIDWHAGFDIAPHETVEFIQPGAWAHVLNRDTTSNATRIDGHLLANGQVTIANPFGVWFGSQAVVDVAQLTAAAGTISNEDFLAGRRHFSDVVGDVFNAGSIQAQRVALIGRQVSNQGQIVSSDGSVLMLAGEEVWIGEWGSPIQVGLGTPAGDSAAVENRGTIDAGQGGVRMAAGDLLGLAIRNRGTVRGGEIVLDGATGDVEVSGFLDAADRGETGTGGRIEIGGHEIALERASLDASGENGGGEILVGGRAHGEVRDLGNATRTAVDAESVLRADARVRGHGGTVVVWADDSTGFHGEISARGGAQGGDGGFVETSGRTGLDVAGARIDASAAAGQAGEWLLDPRDIQIVSSEEFGGNLTPPGTDPRIFTPDDEEPLTAPASVNSGTIADALNTGTSVTIQTTGSSAEEQEGTISVLSGVSTSIPEGQAAQLTLQAEADILFEADVEDSGSGALNLTLEAGRDIKIGSRLVIPDGKATLTAGKDNDSGSIKSFNPDNTATITARELDLTAAEDIATFETTLTGIEFPFATFKAATPTLTQAKVREGVLWIEQTGVQDLLVKSASTDAGGSLEIVNAEGGLEVVQITTQSLVEDGLTTQFGNVELTSAGDLEITGAIETDGGFVDLETTKGSIKVAETGTITTTRKTVESASDFGGNLGMESASDIVILGKVSTGGGFLVGGYSKATGLFNSFASAVNDIKIDGLGEIDTRLFKNPASPTGDPLSAGAVQFEAGGDIHVAADISASFIQLVAEGSGGDSSPCTDSAICFGNLTPGEPIVRPTLRAYDFPVLIPDPDQPSIVSTFSSAIFLEAGNLDGGSTPQNVNAKNALFTGSRDDTNPSTFAIGQTADLLDGVGGAAGDILPETTAFGAANLADMLYGINVIRTDPDDASTKLGTIELKDASKVANADLLLYAGEKIILDFSADEPLELGFLGIEVAGDLDIGDSFAQSVEFEELSLKAASDISITKPRLSASKALEVVAGVDKFAASGDLSIGANVTLEAPVRMALYGGNTGRGGISFQENVKLISDAISLTAGTGSLQYKVDLVVDGPGQTRFEQAGINRAFEIVQDASITTADLPQPSAFSEDIRRPPGHRLDGLNYTLVSREGQILLDPAAPGLSDVAKFKGTNLTLLAEDGVSITTSSPIEVNTAQIGGLGPFTVTKQLADQIRFAEKVDGSDADGQLSFLSGAGSFDSDDAGGLSSFPDLTFQVPETENLEIHADQLTLSAGFSSAEAPENLESIVELPDDRLVFLNQHGHRHSAPDTFVFQQTHSVESDNLPGARFFGNSEGPENAFEVVSAKAALLESPAALAVPEGSKLIATAPLVEFDVLNQNLDLGERDLQVEANALLFSAGQLGGNSGYRVLAQHLSPGSLRLFPLVPEDGLIIRQEGAIRGNELPSYEAWDGNEGPKGTFYELQTFDGGIDLSGGLNRVKGSRLRLLVDKADSEINFGSGKLEVDSLFVTNSGRLQLTAAETGTILQAKDSIQLHSACGPTSLETVCNDFYQNPGNLSLQGNLTLAAPEIRLNAGHVFLQVPPGDSGPVIDIARDVRFDLTSEESNLFSVRQFGDLTDTANNLPARDQFEGTSLDKVDQYQVTSDAGNVTITNLADINPKLLFLVTLTRSKQVRIEKAVGSLVGELANTTILANNIVLEALEPGGKGYVNANNDSLKLELGSDGSFEIRQSKAFDPSSVDSGKLPLASQFFLPDDSLLTYKVTSTAGDIVVNETFGPSAAGSQLVLQSGPQKEVRFENGIDSSANLYSLEVNTDPGVESSLIALALAEGESIHARFDQVYGAPVELRSDAHVAASSADLSGKVVFEDTVGTDTPGDHTLTVEIDESVRFAADVGENEDPDGAGGKRLGSLRIQATEKQPGADPIALFGPEAITNFRTRVGVYTAGDIELFEAGRSTIPATATVYMQQTQSTSTRESPDLRFDSATGSVLMGTNEKLSLPGVLAIEAGEEARVGDLSALELYVNAPAITLLRRGEGPVLHSDGSIGTDGGVDYVANTMIFQGNVGSTGWGQRPAFGLPNPFVVPDFVRANGYPAASINADNTPLVGDEFTLGSQPGILDLQPLGASSADLAEAFWIPTPVPFVLAPPHRLTADPAQLIEIGMALLPTSVAEYQSRLHGAGLLDDVDSGVRLASAPAWVSEARILPKDANQALAAYRRVLGPRRENAGRIREVLQDALDDYRSLTGARRVVGFEFRRYLKNRPSSQFEAYVTLEDLDALFLHQRRSGLVAAEFQHVQEAWLEEITPDGITPEELSQAIFPSRYVRGSEILDVYGE